METEKLTLTKIGLQNLKKQRKTLEKRLQSISKVLNENRRAEGVSEDDFEYCKSAQERLYLIDEIFKLTRMINNCKIVKNIKNDKIQKGNHIKLANHKICYLIQLVDPIEAEPSKGRVSTKSPMGKELINKKVGDQVEIDTPKGNIKFRVVEIR